MLIKDVVVAVNIRCGRNRITQYPFLLLSHLTNMSKTGHVELNSRYCSENAPKVSARDRCKNFMKKEQIAKKLYLEPEA